MSPFYKIFSVVTCTILFQFIYCPIFSLGNSFDFSSVTKGEQKAWLQNQYDSLGANNFSISENQLDWLTRNDTTSNDSLLSSWKYLFVAKHFYYLQEFDTSYKYLNYSIEFVPSQNNGRLFLETNYMLATVLFEVENYDESSIYYLEALKYTVSPKQALKIIEINYQLGHIKRSFQDYKSALSFYHEAEKELENIDDVQLETKIALKKARTLGDLSLFDDAKKEFEELINVCEKEGLIKELVKVYINLAHMSAIRNDFEAAVLYFNSATRKSELIEEVRVQSEIYFDFGELWYELGSYDKSNQYLTKAIGLVTPETSKKLIANIYLVLGKSKYKQNKYDEARKYLINSIELYEKVVPDKALLEAYAMLSKVFYLAGEFEPAYHYLKISKILGDSIVSKENSKNLNELRSRFEIEKNRQTISSLKEVTQIYESEKSKSQNYLISLSIGFVIVLILSLYLFVQNRQNEKKINRLETHNKEVSLKNESLQSASSLAKQSSYIQDQFMGSVSQELKTPLTSILGTLEIIEKTELNKDQLALFETLKLSSNNLHTVINQLLDFSTINKGEVELNIKQCDLPQILEELSVVYENRAAENKVKFQSSIDENLPRWCYVDSLVLRKVLGNLLDNAVKFTHVGNIFFTAKVLEKGKTFNGVRVKVEFSVKDNGIGISQEMQDLIFSAFTKESGSISKTYQGIGLGLSICKEYTRAMGGQIKFESEAGVGSEFKIILEFKSNLKSVSSIAENERKEKFARFNNEVAVLHPLEILVAEDNFTNMTYILTVLRKMGYDPVGVVNGQEAIDMVEERKFDIIFMDIQMPIMDGITATQEIQKKYPQKERPAIIAVTANASGMDKDDYLSIGLDDFISKPFTSKILENILVKWYNKIHDLS